MMIKQTLKSVIKPLLLTASLVVLGAPPLAYATHREKHLLSQEEKSKRAQEEKSKRANVFLDALEQENPKLLVSSEGNTYHRPVILRDIVVNDRLVLSNIQSLPKEAGSL
jgi:hypothetical protein